MCKRRREDHGCGDLQVEVRDGEGPGPVAEDAVGSGSAAPLYEADEDAETD